VETGGRCGGHRRRACQEETADNEGIREDQQREITEKLESMAVPMDRQEFTRGEYNTLFPEGKVKTPLATVKLGAHQFERLKERKREKLLGAMRQTLEDPIVILPEERDGKTAHVYIKNLIRLSRRDRIDQHLIRNSSGKHTGV
jgi:hypothetical protein